MRRECAPRHHHDPDDALAIKRQPQCKVTLIRHGTSLTAASDLTRPDHNVALDILELNLRLFRGELLVSARLLKHVPARCAPRYTTLDAAVQCPAFTVANANAFPVSFTWVTTLRQAGAGVVAAGATVALPAQFAPRSSTTLIVNAGSRVQDTVTGRC